jgi:hypothetical protein
MRADFRAVYSEFAKKGMAKYGAITVTAQWRPRGRKRKRRNRLPCGEVPGAAAGRARRAACG